MSWEQIFNDIEIQCEDGVLWFNALHLAKSVGEITHYLRTIQIMEKKMSDSICKKDAVNDRKILTSTYFLKEDAVYYYLFQVNTQKALGFQRFLVKKLEERRKQEISDAKLIQNSLERQLKKAAADINLLRIDRFDSTDCIIQCKKIINNLMDGNIHSAFETPEQLAEHCLTRYLTENKKQYVDIDELEPDKRNRIIDLAKYCFYDSNYAELQQSINDVITGNNKKQNNQSQSANKSQPTSKTTVNKSQPASKLPANKSQSANVKKPSPKKVEEYHPYASLNDDTIPVSATNITYEDPPVTKTRVSPFAHLYDENGRWIYSKK